MNVNKKNNMPFVSIIIPVYNSQKYLKTTVESLLSQTYRDFEIILVDDGSTDTSGELCDDLVLTDSRVSVIHKTNGGVSDARNVGIERAKGELIWFVDHDDFVFPDYLETMISEFGEYDLIQSLPLRGTRDEISSCHRSSLDKDKTLLCIKGENGALVFPKIDVNNMATIWNQLYKRVIINKYHIRFRKIQSEDELFSYEYMMYANSIKKINYQEYFFIYNSDSQGSKHNYIAEYDYIQQMEDLYKRILENWSIKDKDYIQKIKIRIAIRIVHYLLKGYLADTRVSRKERLRRWNNAKKDSFTNLKVVSYLNYKENFIYLMARLGGYQVLDPLILWLVDRINR